jgi:hypothetical protein
MHFVRAKRLTIVGTEPAGTEETSSWSVVWSTVGQTVFRPFVGEEAELGSDATWPFKLVIVNAALVRAVRRPNKGQLIITI